MNGNSRGASLDDHVSCNAETELTELEKRVDIQIYKAQDHCPSMRHGIVIGTRRRIIPKAIEERIRKLRREGKDSRPVLSPPRVSFRAPPSPNEMAGSLSKPRLKKKVRQGESESDSSCWRQTSIITNNLTRGNFTPAHPSFIIKQILNSYKTSGSDNLLYIEINQLNNQAVDLPHLKYIKKI